MQAEGSPPHYDDLFLNWTSTLNLESHYWNILGKLWKLLGTLESLYFPETHSFIGVKTGPTE